MPLVGSGKLESSGKLLLASNILAILVALVFKYDYWVVIWSYWLESVIVGVYTFLGLGLSGLRLSKVLGLKTALSYAGFFAVHYGMFHLIYMFFLYIMSAHALDFEQQIGGMAILGGVFFISHGFSFLYNIVLKNEPRLKEVEIKTRKEAIGELGRQMMVPYPRIIPIHLTIIITGFFMPFILIAASIVGPVLLTIFMVLKTGGDLYAHQWIHGNKQDQL